MLAVGAVLVVYAGVALWSTWPLAKSPATRVPLGDLTVTTVPLLNVWSIWWNADRLPEAFRGYWDAPIFHPARGTFAFSEPQPATLLVAPVIWLTGSRVLAYNVYLWLSLVLNGVLGWRLLRVVGLRRGAALAGGGALVLLPLVHWQRDVVQIVSLWGILWTWTAIVRISRRPTLLRGVELGAAVAVTFFACVHHGMFLAVLLAGAVWTLWDCWLRARTWLAFLAAAAVAVALVGPIILGLRQAIEKYEFERPPELVAQLSAKPGDYTAPWGRQWIDFGPAVSRPNWTLSPGWLKWGLAAVGVVFGVLRRRWRRWTAFLLVTTVLAFLLSLGPHLEIRGWQPWWTLTEAVPGFAQVRNVFRFAFFVQMAAVLFAAQALYGLFLVNRRCAGRSPWRWGGNALVAVLGLAMVFEVRPHPPKLADVPDAAAHSGWIEFVRDRTPAGQAIACLPFSPGHAMPDFEISAQWMYLGTYHGVPLVNGYSGFFPNEYFEVREAVSRWFPSKEILLWFAERDVEFLVARRSWIAPQELDGIETAAVRVERVFSDPVGIDVYRLRRRK